MTLIFFEDGDFPRAVSVEWIPLRVTVTTTLQQLLLQVETHFIDFSI